MQPHRRVAAVPCRPPRARAGGRARGDRGRVTGRAEDRISDEHDPSQTAEVVPRGCATGRRSSRAARGRSTAGAAGRRRERSHRRGGRDRGLDQRRLRRGCDGRGGDGRCRAPTVAGRSSSRTGSATSCAGTVGPMCAGSSTSHHEPTARRARGDAADLEATDRGAPGGDRRRWSTAAGGRESLRRRRRRDRQPGTGELLDANVEPRGARACRRGAIDACGLRRRRRAARHRACACTPVQAHPPRMVVFGAIDFSAALVPLAKASGYRVTIADPRRRPRPAALLRRRRDHAAGRTRCWTGRARRRVKRPISTHDPKLDVPAVQAVLGTGAATSARAARATPEDRTRACRKWA